MLQVTICLFFSVCLLKVPPGTLAQLWQGCVCDTAALRQNYATSPSKCHLPYHHHHPTVIFSLLLPWGDYCVPWSHSISSDLPLTLLLFTDCFCAVEIKLFYLLCHSFSNSLLVSSVLMEGLVTPLQDRIEEWKKTANQLDKDHAKGAQQENTYCKYHMCKQCIYWIETDTSNLFSTEYKRSRQEIKRKSLDTIKLQKKARKGEEKFSQWQELPY